MTFVNDRLPSDAANSLKHLGVPIVAMGRHKAPTAFCKPSTT
jgi:hypothetical protein